jgi:hypothetical protein
MAAVQNFEVISDEFSILVEIRHIFASLIM